jgi:hypothetical protein
VRRAPRSAPRPRTGEGAAKRGRGPRSGGGSREAGEGAAKRGRGPRSGGGSREAGEGAAKRGREPRSGGGGGPQFLGAPGGRPKSDTQIFQNRSPKKYTEIFSKTPPRPPRCAARVRGPCRSDGACRWAGTSDAGKPSPLHFRCSAPAPLPSVRHGHRLDAPNGHPWELNDWFSLAFMRPRIPPDYRRVSVARERSAEYRLGACSHFTHRNPTDEFPAPLSIPGDPARPACGGKIGGGSTTRTLRGIAAARHPARSSRLSDGRTATASRIRDGRPKAAFTARPPDPGTVKHSNGFLYTGSQATAVTATHGPRYALRRPRARAMPFGWRVPPGRTSDAGKPSPLHFRCSRPCGPSIRPPRSSAGRSERASVETQRLVFACVHETPDSARLQAGIRGTRAFGGLPPRRLLSFHTSKPNRRVSRSPVHSGRSRPSRLWRGGSTTRTLRGIAAARHPARSSRLSDGRTATASRIRDGRPKSAFTARPPDPGTVKHSDGCRQAGSQATAVTATHGPRPPRCAARVRGPCRSDGACRWGTAFGRRQAVAASLPNANAPAALPSVRHGHRLGAPNMHP